MREIKFRAWDLYNECMFNVGDIDWRHCFVGEMEADHQRYLKDVILMQYTGLKDKNGLDIYEGDIIEEYLSDSEDDNYLYSGVIVYFNTEFCLKIKNDTYIKLVNTGNNLEVIGNIYQNPELLTNTE